MDKLTRILFARPAPRDALASRGGEQAIPARRRARPTLICVWTPDPATGRLICTWKRPTDESASAALGSGEPPPALRMAA